MLERKDAEAALQNLADIDLFKRRRMIFSMYPDEGPLRRELYPKHMEFFRVGKSYRERCAMAGNRVGKTVGMGGYESTCHLTGWYPDWWEGKRFSRPVKWWVAGKTAKTTREILQEKLLGKVVTGGGGKSKGVDGTGLIPYEWIGKVTWGDNVRDAVDSVRIKNLFGGWSTLGFKSFEQGRGAFEGTEQDGILLDEEPPLAIYSEALIRTTSTTGRYEDNGIIILTFTPLEGMSDTVISFLPEDMRPTIEEDKSSNAYN